MQIDDRIDASTEEIEARAREAASTEGDARSRGERARELFIKLAGVLGLDEDAVRAGTAPQSEAVGTLDARVVIRTFERDTVESLLPRGLELAPQPLVHSARHPVLFLFAHDTFEAWFGDMEYREMMIAIPYVQRTDLHIPHRGPFLYMPRLYLDSKRPRRLGNRLYGFEKLDAAIETQQDSDGESTYTVRELDRDEVVRLTSSASGPWSAPSEVPNFEVVRQMFEMPTVSQGARIYNRDAWSERDSEGFFIASNIRYAFDDADSRIQPLRSTLLVDSELTPRGLRTDPFVSRGLDETALGSFRMQVRQTVSLPASCSDTYFPTPSPPKRKKVLVLGGGPSACTAAFYLAQQRERYEVHLYTQGWRLGGKCAAGRGEGESERIEEHGLHAFVGFYDNVFRTMTEVYKTVGLPLTVGEAPFDHAQGEGPLAGAFRGLTGVGLIDKRNDRWSYFETGQTHGGRVPGQIPQSEADELPGIGQLLLAVIERIAIEVATLRGRREDAGPPVSTLQTEESTWWRELVGSIRELFGGEADDDAEASTLAGLLDKLTDYEQELISERVAEMAIERSPVLGALKGVFSALRSTLKRVYADDVETDRDVWFTWSNLDLVLTVAIGIIESGATNADALDHLDYRDWLLANGLDPRNRDIAAVTMVYNALFANELDPETDEESSAPRPGNLACGVALRWFLLLGFGYKGYPAYDFRWSCPQTVFTPLHDALRKLGVKIHFFHEVTELQVEGTTNDTRALTGVVLRQQVRVQQGAAAYDPFLPPGRRKDPQGMGAWPAEPQWDQLHPDDAAAVQREGIDLEDAWSGWRGVGETTLRQGEDFDLCVLGIPLGALRQLARGLYDPSVPTASPAWTAMMRKVGVTPTSSFQLWFDRPWDALYSGPRRELATGFEQPWPSIGDLSHLIEWEGWPAGNTPSFLAYHTGATLPGHPFDEHPPTEREYPQWRQAQAADEIKRWLRGHYAGLYDKLDSWPDFLDALNAPEGVTGEARLDAQYFHAAFQPSNLYVLSQAGTTQYRLGQGESGYRNLFLCGDWTRTSLNSGCVEASVQSGMLASKVISNLPSFIWSPGY